VTRQLNNIGVSNMDYLIEVLKERFLEVNYGEIDGFYEKDQISIEDLAILKNAVEIAIGQAVCNL